jgi:hypothetical protein
MQRSAFQSLHRQALDLYHLRLCSQPRVCVGTMTLINRSFFRFLPVQRLAGAGRRSTSANDPSSEPAPQIAIAPSAGGLLEPTRAGSYPCRNPGLLDACSDLPHFGYVRNTSTVAHRGGLPVIDVGSGITRGRRQSFPPPRLPHEKPIFRCESAPCCTVVQQQIPFTVAQISQPSAPRHGKVSLPVDDDSNWSNGEPWGA